MTTIVVIEDNPQSARMAEKLLKRAKYTVLLAEDGEMGLTTVFENEPDLILIDLGLPDIDGQTVIGLVRQDNKLAHVPIIAFTAWPQEEALDMATRYGCDGVITKPINTRTFANQIGEFLDISSQKNAETTDTQSTTTKEGTIETVQKVPSTDTDHGSETVATETSQEVPSTDTDHGSETIATADQTNNAEQENQAD